MNIKALKRKKLRIWLLSFWLVTFVIQPAACAGRIGGCMRQGAFSTPRFERWLWWDTFPGTSASLSSSRHSPNLPRALPGAPQAILWFCDSLCCCYRCSPLLEQQRLPPLTPYPGKCVGKSVLELRLPWEGYSLFKDEHFCSLSKRNTKIPMGMESATAVLRMCLRADLGQGAFSAASLKRIYKWSASERSL